MLKPVVLLAAMLVTAAPQFGQSACEKYRAIPIPPADKPTPAQAQSLTDCESVILYYGLYDTTADPAQARLCAYTETAAGRHVTETDKAEEPHSNPFFWGPAILMMVYANGNGAPRNFDLALHFACEIDPSRTSASSPRLDQSGRIRHLEQLKAANWQGSGYDVCDADHATDSIIEEYCAGKALNLAGSRRTERLQAIVSTWSSDNQQAFHELRRAAVAFFETKSEAEVDQSDNASSHLMPIPYAKLEDGFLASLTSFERGHTPRFTHADLVKADADLNAVYRETLRRAVAGKGTIKVESIRNTERLWLAYLTSWLTFGRQKYPEVTPDSWRVWLTRERTTQLRELEIIP